MPEKAGFSRLKLVRRKDMPPPPVHRAPYVELGVTSPFSFLRGASDAIELVLTALSLGMDAIGIADRNTLAGVVRMHGACKEAGLKPLIGCRLDRIARQHECTILATNDVHYHAPDRRPLQDVVTCIREKVTITTAGYRLNPNAERHLKSPAEMARLFARWPHAIAATREFADALNFSLDELRYEYPRETVPEGRTPQQYLEHLTWEGAAGRWPDGIPDQGLTQLRPELPLVELLDL